MSDKDKKVGRTIYLKVLEVLKEGVDLEQPHDVSYRTSYECYVENSKGKSQPKKFENNRTAVLDFLEVLSNTIVTTILDEVKNPAAALRVIQSLTHRMIDSIAKGLDVTIINSLDDLKDKLREAGAPPHVIEQATRDVKQQINTNNMMQHPAMAGLENTELTKEQQASLALTLSSPVFNKSEKN